MAENKKNKRPFLLWVLALVLAVEGIIAIPSGLTLVLKPDGSGFQMPPEWLQRSPFPNYFIPGLILFLLVGVYPLLVAFCLVREARLALAGGTQPVEAVSLVVGGFAGGRDHHDDLDRRADGDAATCTSSCSRSSSAGGC